jgi:hypothetical protein
LVKGGEVFAAFIPPTEPLFLSLPGQTAHELVQYGGAFGAVLHVLQNRHAAIEEFHGLLTKAVGMVEGQLAKEKHRLLEILSYLTALVYHFRNEKERDSLREELEHSIQIQTIRREFHTMGRTIAEALREEGKLEGKLEGNLEARQETLILLLRRKFGRKVTPAIVAHIKRTKDAPTLEEWLGNILDAETLEEVGIPVKK